MHTHSDAGMPGIRTRAPGGSTRESNQTRDAKMTLGCLVVVAFRSECASGPWFGLGLAGLEVFGARSERHASPQPTAMHGPPAARCAAACPWGLHGPPHAMPGKSLPPLFWPLTGFRTLRSPLLALLPPGPPRPPRLPDPPGPPGFLWPAPDKPDNPGT